MTDGGHDKERPAVRIVSGELSNGVGEAPPEKEPRRRWMLLVLGFAAALAGRVAIVMLADGDASSASPSIPARLLSEPEPVTVDATVSVTWNRVEVGVLRIWD